MHFSPISLLLPLLALASPALAGPCHQTNFQRAVQREWQGPAVYARHEAECRVNLACTSTPAAITSTATATVTSGTLTITVPRSTSGPTGVPVAGEGTVRCGTGNIPSDQTAQCDNEFASYASACACAGWGGATATVQARTAVATVTATVPEVVVYV